MNHRLGHPNATRPPQPDHRSAATPGSATPRDPGRRPSASRTGRPGPPAKATRTDATARGAHGRAIERTRPQGNGLRVLASNDTHPLSDSSPADPDHPADSSAASTGPADGLGRAILEQTPEPILGINPTGQLFYANPPAGAWLGTSTQPRHPLTIFDVDPGMSAATWSEHWAALLERGRLAREATRRDAHGAEHPVILEFHRLDHPVIHAPVKRLGCRFDPGSWRIRLVTPSLQPIAP